MLVLLAMGGSETEMGSRQLRRNPRPLCPGGNDMGP